MKEEIKKRIKELEKKLEKAKDEFAKEILNNNELSKLEKLITIANNDLWPVASYIQRVFDKQQKELEAQVKKNTKRDWAITDDCINESQEDRNSIVNIPETIEYMLEDLEEGELLTVLTNRGTPDKIEMTKEQVIDQIYDWCTRNKCVEYHFDW